MPSSLKFVSIIKDRQDYKIEIDSDDFSWRLLLPYSLLVVGFLSLLSSAFELQIVKGGDNYQIAKRTNQAQVKTLAPRGLILTADNVRLAYNTPAYSLALDTTVLSEVDEKAVVDLLAELLELPAEELWDTFVSKAYKEDVRLNIPRLTLKSDLNFDEYYNLLSRIDDLKGVKLNVESIRNYADGNTYSNVVGYIGDPNQSDIDKGIYSLSQVGKTGIESQYDEYLRGKEGLLVEEKEVLSGNSSNYEAFEAIPGNNVFLTIDSQWQKFLQMILEKNINDVKAFAGAGVIVNSRTGAIKALVTAPTYDNNLFAKGISALEYQSLITNPKRPLFNRPISLQLPPGSIIKIIGATAGLEAGIIDENSKKLSDRCMDLPGGIVFCEADKSYIGWVNVKEAMARSSNLFFCQVMQDLRTIVGYKYYYDIARSYGLGQLSGIDLPGEATGLIPDDQYKLRVLKEPWYIGDECNTVIGQGFVTVTPLQMALAVATIMNDGNLMRPYLVQKIEDQSGINIFDQEPLISRNIHINANTIRILQEGMKLGVEAGTGGALKGLPGNPIAKTGSSDAGEWIDGNYYSGAHSWVMGCFDYGNENYCFSVMQQWGGRGYKTVPVMKKFINCLYNDFRSGCQDIK